MSERADRAREAWAALEEAEYEVQSHNTAEMSKQGGWTPKDAELELRDFLTGRALRMADSILERMRREGIL